MFLEVVTEARVRWTTRFPPSRATAAQTMETGGEAVNDRGNVLVRAGGADGTLGADVLTPAQQAHQSRQLYRSCAEDLCGSRADAQAHVKAGGTWKHVSGSYSRPEKGPVNYKCSAIECPARCRAVLRAGMWVVESPQDYCEHSGHSEMVSFKRQDSVFSDEFSEELHLLFDTGSTPTEVCNAIKRSAHARVVALMPADFTVAKCAEWWRNQQRINHKIATLTDLQAWMSGRYVSEDGTCMVQVVHLVHV